MDSTVINAVISLIGTLGGSLGDIPVSSKLTAYRVEQLEKSRGTQQLCAAYAGCGGADQGNIESH